MRSFWRKTWPFWAGSITAASYLTLEARHLFPPLLRVFVFPVMYAGPFAVGILTVIVQDKGDRLLATVSALLGSVVGFCVGSDYAEALSLSVFGPVEGYIRIDLLLWSCIPTGLLGSLSALVATGMKHLIRTGWRPNNPPEGTP